MFDFFKSSPQKSPTTPSSKNPERLLKDFIDQAPNASYTFDSERGAPESEICRDTKEKGMECRMIQMHATKLFEVMQDNGFFCALPMDPSRTHMECRRMPKS
ncbi:hypothetical protein JAAARDRAFT_31607 [Jaapia argillacea MUCL 33604]|uniref:Uncharacterized protein n=1 Tax=Jaapia argillacea MUCL 33604 TaxID=933084 RepID=A0A067Q0N7_9AGAM|nr:hypothetical protein JAAARDRAFT_31607 [Jaapia argillacea MUCL 33604]